MKKFLIILFCSILILSGCGNQQQSAPTIPQMSPETTPDIEVEVKVDESTVPIAEEKNTQLLSVAVPASTERYTLDDGTELFSYTAQHMQLLMPNEEVADKIILNFLNRVDAAKADAESVMNAAQNNYDTAETWYPYFYQVLYSPTRIDHSVLSLFGTQNSYSGGMHGSVSCVSANYDLTNGDILTLGSIMHKNATKEQFIELIIEKLRLEADQLQLFDGFEEGVYGRLGGDENLYEDFYFTTTGLTFYFAPYEIAPYAAGIITVELPYEALPGLIYDGYFPAEREQIQGTVHTSSFMDTDMEQFNNIAEIKLTTGEEIIVAYPEGTVEDIRVVIPGDGKSIPEYTVFAAMEMSANNAIVLSVAENDLSGISIQYVSEGIQNALILD